MRRPFAAAQIRGLLRVRCPNVLGERAAESFSSGLTNNLTNPSPTLCVQKSTGLIRNKLTVQQLPYPNRFLQSAWLLVTEQSEILVDHCES